MRIARELHDVVAHHVSAMGVQAGAARAVLDRDTDAARTALLGVEASARSALVELRQLLETLRTSGGEAEGGSTVHLSGLADLIAHYAAGQPVASADLLRAARAIGIGPASARVPHSFQLPQT